MGEDDATDVNSIEAQRWALTLRIAEIIHEEAGINWPKATTVAADIVSRCSLLPAPPQEGSTE